MFALMISTRWNIINQECIQYWPLSLRASWVCMCGMQPCLLWDACCNSSTSLTFRWLWSWQWWQLTLQKVFGTCQNMLPSWRHIAKYVKSEKVLNNDHCDDNLRNIQFSNVVIYVNKVIVSHIFVHNLQVVTFRNKILWSKSSDSCFLLLFLIYFYSLIHFFQTSFSWGCIQLSFW